MIEIYDFNFAILLVGLCKSFFFFTLNNWNSFNNLTLFLAHSEALTSILLLLKQEK